MRIRAISLAVFIFLLFVYSSLSITDSNSSLAQTQSNKQEVPAWKSKLYEKDVKYDNFTCDKVDSEVVSTYFKENTMKRYLPICHNNCPIIKCRPVIPTPPAAKALKITDTVSVHVLVDEKGKVLYARTLSGHPLLRDAVQKGASETQFKEYPYGKHQGIMHFTVEDDFLDVPNRANQVW